MLFLKKLKMSRKFLFRFVKNAQSSLKLKMTASLLSIVAVLLVSSVISVMEYRSMSDYVSELIADDISSINVASRLADMSNTYNLDILEVIGDGMSSAILPDFDDEYFKSHCDSLRSSVATNQAGPLADSVMYSYAAYMLTSLELEEVIVDDFTDTRAWYFNRLQPKYDRLRSDIDKLTDAIYNDLANNSKTFDRGFYRSTVPGMVAVGVGILLVLMLLLFINSLYVNPLYKMNDSLRAYRVNDKKYRVDFYGDDQLTELNEGISELANENQQLRRRIRELARGKDKTQK